MGACCDKSTPYADNVMEEAKQAKKKETKQKKQAELNVFKKKSK